MCKILEKISIGEPLSKSEKSKLRKHQIRTSPEFLEYLQKNLICSPKSKSGLIYRKNKEQAGFLSSCTTGVSYKVYIQKTYFTSAQLILLLNGFLPKSPTDVAARKDETSKNLVVENLQWQNNSAQLPSIHYRHTRAEKSGHYTAMYRNGLKLMNFGYIEDPYLAHLHALEQAYLLDIVDLTKGCTLQHKDGKPFFRHNQKPEPIEVLTIIHRLRFAALSA